MKMKKHTIIVIALIILFSSIITAGDWTVKQQDMSIYLFETNYTFQAPYLDHVLLTNTVEFNETHLNNTIDVRNGWTASSSLVSTDRPINITTNLSVVNTNGRGNIIANGGITIGQNDSFSDYSLYINSSNLGNGKMMLVSSQADAFKLVGGTGVNFVNETRVWMKGGGNGNGALGVFMQTEPYYPIEVQADAKDGVMVNDNSSTPALYSAYNAKTNVATRKDILTHWDDSARTWSLKAINIDHANNKADLLINHYVNNEIAVFRSGAGTDFYDNINVTGDLIRLYNNKSGDADAFIEIGGSDTGENGIRLMMNNSVDWRIESGVAWGNGLVIKDEENNINHLKFNFNGGLSIGNNFVSTNPGAGKTIVQGYVGINETNPQQALHIKDVMRLEPRSTAPDNAALGDLYVDSDTSELCFFDGGVWVGISAGGVCA